MLTASTGTLTLPLSAGLAATRALFLWCSADLATQTRDTGEFTNCTTSALSSLTEKSFCCTGFARALAVLVELELAELAEFSHLVHSCKPKCWFLGWFIVRLEDHWFLMTGKLSCQAEPLQVLLGN